MARLRCAQPLFANKAKRLEAGFTLLNVLVSMLIFSFGLLALAGVYARLTTAATQNQNVTQLGPWSNEFWGIVQANPSVIDSMANAGTSITYTVSNCTNAGGCINSTNLAALVPWVERLTDNTLNPLTALPGAQIVISPASDYASGSTCASATGCTVVVQVTWTQPSGSSANDGSMGPTRTQYFNYQFGGF